MDIAVEPATGSAVDSRLESVVVYAQGAICTRRARVTVPDERTGELRVQVGELPPGRVAQSLRGSVAGGAASPVPCGSPTCGRSSRPRS
ncbi:hypothetical protein ACU686_20040 [Yinghuangia aomiensis]